MGYSRGRTFTAVQLAKVAGYYLVRSKIDGLVFARGDVLEIGSGACEHEIASAACRKQLEAFGADENAVRRLVTSHGYFHVPKCPTATGLAAVQLSQLAS